MVFVGGFFIDQIALRYTANIGTLAVEFLIAAASVVHILLQRHPVYRHISGISGGNGGVGDVLLNLFDRRDGIAELRQRAVDNLGLKRLFR